MAKKRRRRLTAKQKRLAEEAIAIIPHAIRGFERAYPGISGKLAKVDAVSVANLAVVNAAMTYDPAIAKMTTYFGRAIQNALLKELHKETRLRYQSPCRVPIEAAEMRQQCESWKNDLYAAWKALGEEQRKLVRLRYFDGKTFEEMAADLGCDRRTVRRRLTEALIMMGAPTPWETLTPEP